MKLSQKIQGLSTYLEAQPCFPDIEDAINRCIEHAEEMEQQLMDLPEGLTLFKLYPAGRKPCYCIAPNQRSATEDWIDKSDLEHPIQFHVETIIRMNYVGVCTKDHTFGQG